MACIPQELESGYRTGECLVEPRQNRFVRIEFEVRCELRVMDVLVRLAERAGEVVSRATPNRRVRGNFVVTDRLVAPVLTVSANLHVLCRRRPPPSRSRSCGPGPRVTASARPLPACGVDRVLRVLVALVLPSLK